MKRYFLNPGDIVCAIVLISLGGIFQLLVTTFIFLNFTSTYSNVDIMAATALYLMPLPRWIGGLLYLNKYGGHIYLHDNRIILQKGKKLRIIEIADIRWIELKHDVRSRINKGSRKDKGFRFFIRLNDQKKDLDFIITNNIILEIIKNHNIRIMPDWYNKEYLNTGSFDFLCK